MSVNNTAIGSVLVIPEGLLNDMEKVDKKLKSIQEKSEETAKTFNTSFKGMNDALVPLIPNIDKIVSGLTKAAEQSERMGKNMGGAVNGINSLNGSITSVSEMLNRLRTLVQTPTSGNGNFMSHVSTLMDAVSVRVSGLGAKFSDFKRQLLALDTAAMQQAMKSQSDAKVRLANEKAATTLAKVNLEQEKQNRLYAQAATEAAKLARAQAQLAQAQAMAATAQERATAANERAAKNATIRQYGASASSALSYVNDKANTGTYHQRAIAIKVLEDAIKNLNKTDADYQKNLGALSERYKQLKSEQDAVNNSMGKMHESHRKLMDTSGHLQRAFALMFSVSQIRGYISQIAKVRGEFELQQRSLEAILQNKTKADEIFNKTVALAVQSPFQIKDLISYTKQLAAYRIESDKLYDTTKRLADVSAGLGVDMQRLILAYGQVKAAAYLRGTEVRQFTEAGINLYGELQAYFKEVKGEAYTTAQIVDMISKRMVTFEDVEAIFRRITDQGGIFYNMQAIQAETLQGKIANLKDSVDIMLNDIGKANEGAFKGTIDAASYVIRNWEAIANTGKALVGVFMLLKIHSLQTGAAMSSVFTKTMMTNAASTLKFTELLHYGFLNLGKSVKIFGANMKAAFMTNLPLIAITTAAMTAYEAYNRINSYNKAITKSNEELVKERVAVTDLVNEYNNLQTASNNASKMQERNQDTAKDIEAKRNALQKLIDLAEKNGLTLNVKVAEVKDEELNAVFNGVKEKYTRFLTDIAILQRKTAQNKAGNAWYTLSDNIDEDATDYKNAVIDILAQTDKLDAAIANVKYNYDNLSDASKKFYATIAQGNIDGESQIDFYKRMYEAIKKIGEIETKTEVSYDYNGTRSETKIVPEWFKGTEEYLKGFSRYFKDVDRQSKEFAKELDDVLGGVIEQMRKRGEEGVVIKAVIDKYAAQQGYDDIQKMFMYQHFNVKVEFDKDDINKSIGSIKQQLDNAFANNVYTISFKLAGVDSKTGYKQLNDEMKLQLNELQELVEMKKNLEGGNYEGYDPVALNAKINELYKDISEMGKGYKELANRIMGYNKASKTAAKVQRDILSEQVALLKEMQKRYEDLRSIMGEQDAKTNVLAYYSDSLKNVKMPKSIINSFVPTREGVIKALEKLLPTIHDFKKKMDVRNTIAELKLQKDRQGLEKELDNAKKEIEKAFDGFALNTKLTDLGLHVYDIDKLFPGLTKSLNDVRNTIYREFSMTPEMLQMDEAQLKLKMGEKKYQEYTSAIKKLNDKEVDDQRRNIEQLVKDYKNHIDSKLQIDLWYANERDNINQNISDSTLRAEMQSNLYKQYKEKVDENKWKSFQNSNAYIKIFSNLESASKQTLDYLYSRLENLKSSLKNLSPENLKQVVEAMNKIDSERTDRNPFKGLTKNIKEYIKYLKERKKLEQERNASLSKEEELSAQAEQQNALVQFYEKQYELAKKIYGEKEKVDPIAKKAIADAEKQLKKSREELQALKEKLKTQKQITDKKDDELNEGEQAANNTNKAIQAMGDYAQQTATAVRGIGDAFGGLSSEAEVAVDIIDNIGQAIGNYYAGNYGGMVASGMGALSGIFQLASGDISRRNKISDLTAEVDRLQNAFERLQDAMDDVWDITNLQEYRDDAVKDLELMNRKLQQMIELEKECKNPDQEKIAAWENQIQDNLDTIIELEENFYEKLGGIGSDSNIKSAAQEFVDAWVDAFNEGGDTLDALNGKLDELVDNLVRKQMMMRVTNAFLKPIFDLIDKSVSADGKNANGLEELRAGLEKLKAERGNWLEGADDYLKLLSEFFGMSPNADNALSELQQGIQGITENTASALEGLLNSMRFFLATQQADVAVIKNYLLSKGDVVSDSSTTSPMLTELKNQTVVLRNIQSMWDRVIKPMTGGYGIRVIGIS